MQEVSNQKYELGTLQTVVRSLARLFAKSFDDAEDIAQNIMLKTVRGTVQPGRVSTAWLFVVAKNAACDYYRREARQQAVCERLAMYMDLESGEPSLSAVAEDSDPYLVKCVSEALRLLPRSSARAFLLHAAGHGYAEIAAATDTKVGTVRSRLHYARRSLQRALQPRL